MKLRAYFVLLVLAAPLTMGAADVFADAKSPSGAGTRTPTFEEAQAMAQKARRTLVLEFGARWCQPCKEFDRRVLPQAAVQRALGEVIYIHYDAEAAPGMVAARTLKIVGYPTFVAIGQQGRIIDRIEGYRSAREFIEWVAHVASDWESDDSLQVRISREPSNAEALLVLGRRQAQRGQDAAAEATLLRAAAAVKSGGERVTAVAAAIDWELRIVRLRRILREAPRQQMAEHLLAFPRSANADAAFRELSRRGPADALSLRALDSYVDAHLDAKEKKAQETLNEIVYGCLRVAAYDAAERAAKRLLSLDEKNPLYLDTLAEVMHLRGDRAKALTYSEQAVAAADSRGAEGKELRPTLLKNQARFARSGPSQPVELPAELLTEEEELSPWERSVPPTQSAVPSTSTTTTTHVEFR